MINIVPLPHWVIRKRFSHAGDWNGNENLPCDTGQADRRSCGEGSGGWCERKATESKMKRRAPPNNLSQLQT